MPDNPTTIDTADVLAIDAAVAKSTDSGLYGLTRDGFVPKPFSRLLAEKLALARALLGDNLDLGSGSSIRKLLEISALEDARTWSALAGMYDNAFISSASGEALSRLGAELNLTRPFLEAHGTIRLKLVGKLPSGVPQINLPRGARLSSPGGHHVATAETVVLSTATAQRDVAVVAFFPGPEHNLNPNEPAQKLDRWNRLDPMVAELDKAEKAAGEPLVAIEHTTPFTGGEKLWPDARYRELLLRAPRSIWTLEAIQIAASLVPGVRQVSIKDALGGLDITQSIFGNFNFIERLFGSERDLGSPYYFTVMVAPTPGAIWDGPDGLHTSVENAIEDLRPIGIFPQITEAEQIGVGVAGKLVVEGLPLPTGGREAVNSSAAAVALKERLLARLRRYVDGLQFGEPVRASELTWTIMNEPGLADVLELTLLRYPANFEHISFDKPVTDAVQKVAGGQNVKLQGNQIAVFVDDASGLQII